MQNQSFTQTALFQSMQTANDKQVAATLKSIKMSIEARRAYELEERGGELSKDFQNVAALNDETFARFAIAIGLNPGPFISSPLYEPEEFEKASGIPAEAKTGNQKGYKKTLGAAHYFYHGDRKALERVLKTFVACSIVSARYHLVIPRDVCTRFLDSLDMRFVSDELREVIAEHRAKHMSGGAETQTSQCTLQLANMRAAKVIRNGRRKDFMLDVKSPVIEAFAERFGMTEELEKARAHHRSLLG